MDGILVINKEKGYTSNDVVQKVKKILNVKKVGHAGTLDPLATGVLPILVGEGTKLSKYLINHDKTYVATIKLGEKKDTGDLEGKTIESAPVGNYTKTEIELVLKSFLGKQKQIPPMYSAIKKNGKKLYEYAREGIEIEREARDIEIYNISLIDYADSSITFKTEVSKGTYMRVLCENIAEKLGTVGYMFDLVRTRVNNFNIENAVRISKLENDISESFISIENFFKINDKIYLDAKQEKLLLNGVLIDTGLPNGIYRIYNTAFIGIGIVKNHKLKRDIIIKNVEHI